MINVSTILIIIITILIIIMQSSSSSSSSTSSSSHLQMSRHLFLSSPHSSSPQVTKRNIMSKVFIRYHPLRSTQIGSYNNTPHLNRLIGRPLHPPREGTKMFFLGHKYGNSKLLGTRPKTTTTLPNLGSCRRSAAPQVVQHHHQDHLTPNLLDLQCIRRSTPGPDKSEIILVNSHRPSPGPL